MSKPATPQDKQKMGAQAKALRAGSQSPMGSKKTSASGAVGSSS
jgi:hypothetical protein